MPRAHASYEALAADPEVDIVYVATPHVLHRENCLLALRHGKAVLCEKPFAINAAEAAEVFALARAKGLFVMEAMWTRFLPAIVKVREMLAAGAIGEPRWLAADFGFQAPFNPQSRIFDPALGGGALLDVGRLSGFAGLDGLRAAPGDPFDGPPRRDRSGRAGRDPAPL